MIKSKEEFIKQFARMAEEEADVICPKNREAWIANWFETKWQEHVKWYKEQYPKKYEESLTLEQLYRLNH